MTDEEKVPHQVNELDRMPNRNLLTHEEIQEAELAILDAFLLFCAKRSLRTTPIGGTMLGAVRHGGFIPWDDDIDMGMPRPDYDRLLSLRNDLEAESGCRLLGYASADASISPFCKLVDPRIEVQADREIARTCLWIDVMPIDALPKDDGALGRLYARARLCQRGLMFLASTPESSPSRLRRALKRVASPLRRSRLLIGLIASRLNRLGKGLEYGSTPYAGVLTWGMYGTGERFHLSGLEDMSTCTFEGLELPCMSCWDEYLSGIYGDYMTLPPEEKRVTHGLKAWRVDRETE